MSIRMSTHMWWDEVMMGAPGFPAAQSSTRTLARKGTCHASVQHSNVRPSPDPVTDWALEDGGRLGRGGERDSCTVLYRIRWV